MVTLLPITGNQQSEYVLDDHRLVGFVPTPPLPFASLIPMVGALVNVPLARNVFDDTGCGRSGVLSVGYTRCWGKPRRFYVAIAQKSMFFR